MKRNLFILRLGERTKEGTLLSINRGYSTFYSPALQDTDSENESYLTLRRKQWHTKNHRFLHRTTLLALMQLDALLRIKVITQ